MVVKYIFLLVQGCASVVIDSGAVSQDDKVGLSDLPGLAWDVILEKLEMNSTVISNIKQTSKNLNQILNEQDFGPYSVIGSPSNSVTRAQHPQFCDNFLVNTRAKRQIRHLWMEYDLFIQCKISLETSPLIQSIYLIQTNSQYKEMRRNLQRITKEFPDVSNITLVDTNKRNLFHKIILSPEIPPLEKSKYMTELKSLGINPNGKDIRGNTPMHLCLVPMVNRFPAQNYFDTIDCLKSLLEIGADPNIRNHRGFSPAHFAAGVNHVEPLEYLLERGADLYQVSQGVDSCNGMSLLHLSIEAPRFMEQLEAYDQLISMFADELNADSYFIDERSLEQRSGRNWDTRYLLLYKMSVFNQVDCYGSTALLQSMYHGDLEFAKYFLERNAPIGINEINNDGYNPLLFLLSHNEPNIPLVKFLISRNASVNVADSLSMTPLMHAIEHESRELFYLFLKDSNVQARDNYGSTALMHALSKESVEFSVALIRKGAYLIDRDKRGFSVMSMLEFVSHISVDEKRMLLNLIIEKMPNISSIVMDQVLLEGINDFIFICLSESAYLTDDKLAILLKKIPMNRLRFKESFGSSVGWETKKLIKSLSDLVNQGEILGSSPSRKPLKNPMYDH